MSDLRLVDPRRQEVQVQELPDLIKEMTTIIDDADKYALERSLLGGLDWGVEAFNNRFGGLNPGLHLVAGISNAGKSALCLHLAWSIANANKVKTKEKQTLAYVLYLSLDDNVKDILPRVIAMDQKIEIDAVTKPKLYELKAGGTAALARRVEGIKRLKATVPYFKMVDTTYQPMCDSIEGIEKIVKEYNFAIKELDEDYQLVVFIDNFHDINSAEINFHGDNNARYDYIANALSQLCNTYYIPIICTSELKKLNGNRRPTVDDIRETVKIAYESKVIMLCHNDVGLRGESAQVYWGDAAKEKKPVLEVKVGKNKLSSFKGRFFFEFVPEMSYLREATENGTKVYNSMVSG